MPFDELIGNNFAKEMLTNIIKNGKCVNSCIFYGPSGVGKKQFAVKFAKLLTKHCENIRIVDMYEVQRKKDSQEKYISAVRDLEQYLNFKPANSEKKIAIVDGVEECSTEALNALLKTLEEPPTYAVVILITNNIFALPSTVLSRCHLIQFYAITEQGIVNILCKKYDLNKDDASLIALLSEGSLGRALDVAESTFSKLKKEYLALQKCIASGNFYELKGLLQRSGDSSEAKEKIKHIIRLIILGLRQRLLQDDAKSEPIVASIEKLLSYISYIDNNVNSKLILGNAIVQV